MTGLELLALAGSLMSLGQKMIVENREATEAEVNASFAGRDAALSAAEDAVARLREREDAGG